MICQERPRQMTFVVKTNETTALAPPMSASCKLIPLARLQFPIPMSSTTGFNIAKLINNPMTSRMEQSR